MCASRNVVKSNRYLHVQLQNREIRQAYDVIQSKARRFVNNVNLISIDAFELDGKNSEAVVTSMSASAQYSHTSELTSNSGRLEDKPQCLSAEP